jgi:hypothetical protein
MRDSPAYARFWSSACWQLRSELRNHPLQTWSVTSRMPRGLFSLGATIRITNLGTGAERMTTSSSGEFSIPNLPPASYRMTVEKAGFKTATIASFDLLVGKNADESLSLSIGETTETVEVTSSVQQLQTTEATVGQVIDQRQISRLPLNGRNVLQLATLSAGVSPAQSGIPERPASLELDSFTSRSAAAAPVRPTTCWTASTFARCASMCSLSSPRSTPFKSSTSSAARSAPNTARGRPLSQWSPNPGRTPSRHCLYLHPQLNLRRAQLLLDIYASFPHKPVFHRNQFGATIGAPIVRDRAFIFFGYEGLRSSQAIPQVGFFPSCPLAPSAPLLGNPTTQHHRFERRPGHRHFDRQPRSSIRVEDSLVVFPTRVASKPTWRNPHFFPTSARVPRRKTSRARPQISFVSLSTLDGPFILK